MKLTILILAILGVATAASVPTSKVQSRDTKDLGNDWADFLVAVDVDKAREIIIVYLAEDAEVQAVAAYLKSENFKNLIRAINNIDEFQRFLNYLENGGLNVRKQWDRLLAWLDNSAYTSSRSMSRLASSRITGGIAGLWADLKECLDRELLRELWYDKLENSEEFRALIELLKSDEAKAIYAKLKANDRWQKFRAKAIEYGLDINWAIDWVKALINWE